MGLIVASFSNRLLMIPREIPSYLSVAYDLRFSDKPTNQNILKRIFNVVKQSFQLAKELLFHRPSKAIFNRNISRLEKDFEAIRGRLDGSNKPICAYIVAPYDGNGAILGDRSYYYHHYKIKNFEKNYSVVPFLASSAKGMFEKLKDLKEQNPERKIQVVDFVSHGWPQGLFFPAAPPENQSSEECPCYDINAVETDQFKDCAQDATIILDACSTGKGTGNIAEVLAQKNPGKTFFAPRTSLFFSKPIIKLERGTPSIEHVVHGFAILRAFSAGKFLA